MLKLDEVSSPERTTNAVDGSRSQDKPIGAGGLGRPQRQDLSKTLEIPQGYKNCHTFSDFSDAYAKVFAKQTHRSAGKGSGEIYHVGRWNCTLHQRMARFIRETLTFSKGVPMHEAALECFIHGYDLTSISML